MLPFLYSQTPSLCQTGRHNFYWYDMTTCVSSLHSALLVNGRKEILKVVSKSVPIAEPIGGADIMDKDQSSPRPIVVAAEYLKTKNELELKQVEREENAAKDLDAVGRALSGDLSGFKELVQRYEKRVYNIR